MSNGKIKTLYSDAAKSEALFPRTKVSAVSDADGVGLDAIVDGVIYSDTNGVDSTAEIINADTLGGYSVAGVINLIYPVGSIYMSINSTSPATLFGGTWEQLEDRFLLGAGSTYAAGSSGGEAEHTLTVDEMPSHTHTANSVRITEDSGGPVAMRNNNLSNLEPEVSAPMVSNTGGGEAHNNMPPYLAVYMWKRTA